MYQEGDEALERDLQSCKCSSLLIVTKASPVVNLKGLLLFVIPLTGLLIKLAFLVTQKTASGTT